MNTEPKPADVVMDINSMVYELLHPTKDTKVDGDLLALVTLMYMTDGNYEGVQFLGENLWDDQDNGIPWDDEKDAPSRSLKEHLIIKVKERIASLAPLLDLRGDR